MTPETEAMLVGIFIGVVFSMLFGFAAGMMYAFKTIKEFILADPDGKGGWNSRLEQLGQRYGGKSRYDLPNEESDTELIDKDKG